MSISNQDINLIMASKLDILRRQANYFPHQVAKAMGITNRTYSQLEKGMRPFTQKNINDICQFFKIKKSDFIQKPTKSSLSKYPPYMDELMVALLGELKLIREERNIYMKNLDAILKNQLAQMR
jgi:transcriptional regulator with XRE-family HTH domain